MSHASAVRISLRVLSLLPALALVGCAHLVVLHDPLTPAEHNDLGVAYESKGELALAADQYRRALRGAPHYARARVNLGNIESAKGRWHRAEAHYRRALRDSTTDYDAMNNLAIALHRQQRRTDEAVALARRAVAGGGERDSLYRATLAEVSAGIR